MDFSIPDDLRQLRDTVRNFVYKEAIPLEKQIDAEDKVPERLLEQLRAMGLFGITIPEEYGGVGIGPFGYALISEEIGKAHGAIRALIGINNGIGSRALVSYGTDEQKQRYLPKLASGEFISAFAISEPGAGSDVAAIKTGAVRDGDEFVLNGTKHGMSVFLVEPHSPGFSLGRVQETMGGKGYGRCEIIFDDCRIPAVNLLGEEGHGFQVAMSCLEEGRISYAAGCVGMAQRLLDMSADYAKQRVQFGRPIAEFQAIQFMLAEMATSIYAARMMTQHAAWMCEQNRKCAQEASMVKLFASEMAGRVADSAVQIHGAMGYARDLAVERLYREARLFRIAEGTSEIQKIVIAKKVLR
jgi:acyl-CoA dehydrogenase